MKRAGHEKYLKTTVFGLTGMQPDVVVVVVGANMGVKRMTKEHLAIAVAVRSSIRETRCLSLTDLLCYSWRFRSSLP